MGSKYIKIVKRNTVALDNLFVNAYHHVIGYTIPEEIVINTIQFIKKHNPEAFDVSFTMTIDHDGIEKYLPIAKKGLTIFSLRKSEYKDLPIDWVVNLLTD